MKCLHCGSEITANVKFCPECGTSINSPGSSKEIVDSRVSQSPKDGINNQPANSNIINISASDQIARCPKCKNVIWGKNKSLLCANCGKAFCEECEKFYRPQPRRPGEKPYCDECYGRLTWSQHRAVGANELEKIMVYFDGTPKIKVHLYINGGKNDIRFYVKDQIGNILLNEKRAKDNSEFTIIPKMSGPLFMYLDNKYSAFTGKEVKVEYRAEY